MYIASASEIESLNAYGRLPDTVVRSILDLLSLRPRPTWASTPAGFRLGDWYPWRFRRRLSVISRPILQLTDDVRGNFLIAPGMVRDGAAKVIDYCYRGGYEAKNLPDGPLRKWVGAVENERGHQFNRDVAQRLNELGWEVRYDIKLT